MIPNSGPISLDDIMVELGHSAGTEYSLLTLLDELDNAGTGAGYSAESFFNAGGFTGGNLMHFLRLISAIDIGTAVTVRVQNEAMVDAFAGTLYYEIRDVSENVLASGSRSVSSITHGNYRDYNLTYPSGTPDHVNYKWAVGQGWTIIGMSI